MNNITWGKDMATKDNGERVMYWIPTKDRLPSENGEYLITLLHKTMPVFYTSERGFYSAVIDTILTWPIDNVIAWMKLPEPYKI